MNLPQIATVGFFATTVLKLFHFSAVLSPLTYHYLRVDDSHTSIKKIERSAKLWQKITGICFWNMKSSIGQKVRMSIYIRIFNVATWFAFLLIAVGCCISELFRPLLVFALRATLCFDGGLCTFGSLYLILVESDRQKRKQKK